MHTIYHIQQAKGRFYHSLIQDHSITEMGHPMLLVSLHIWHNRFPELVPIAQQHYIIYVQSIFIPKDEGKFYQARILALDISTYLVALFSLYFLNHISSPCLYYTGYYLFKLLSYFLFIQRRFSMALTLDLVREEITFIKNFHLCWQHMLPVRWLFKLPSNSQCPQTTIFRWPKGEFNLYPCLLTTSE